MHVNILHWSVTTIYRDLSLKLHFPESGGCWRWMLLYGQVEFLSDRLTLDGAPDTSQKLHHKCHSHGQSSLRATRAALRATRAALRATRAALRATRAALRATRAALRATRVALRATRAALRATRVALRATRAALRATRAKIQNSTYYKFCPQTHRICLPSFIDFGPAVLEP